jgi:HAE1 family hydrophobic/amphiphilic exporter-1
LIDAALEGARLRLRPILMTSFAFIFGCLPLWGADGAGAAARRMLGTTVVAGMSAATLLGIFFVPALFVFVERVGGHKDAHAVAPTGAPAGTPRPVADIERPRHRATGGE